MKSLMNLNEIKFVKQPLLRKKKAALTTKGRKKKQKNGRRNTSGCDANSGDFDARERRLRAANLPL